MVIAASLICHRGRKRARDAVRGFLAGANLQQAAGPPARVSFEIGSAALKRRKTMSYIDRTLGKNETILYRAKIHSVFYIRIWALFIILSACVSWLAYIYPTYAGTLTSAALLSCSTIFCLSLIMPLWTLEIALTNLRIVMKRGFLTRRTHELEVQAIEEVNLRQSLPGRILNYGTIIVRGIGDVDDMILKGIADPLAFRKEIASAMMASTYGAQSGESRQAEASRS
jgi:hypothetical protein